MKRLPVLFSLLVSLTAIAGIVWFFYQQKQIPPPSASKTTLVIGANFELSGKYAPSGRSALQGMQLALQEINAAGGLLGKPLTLVIADNKSAESETPLALQTMLRDNAVVAIIGPDISGLAIASAAVCDEWKVPFIATWATNPRVTVRDNGRVWPYAFRACFIDPFQGSVMARFARDSLQAKSAAIYIDDSAAYSKGLAAFFEQSFNELGGFAAVKFGYSPDGTDFSAGLKILLASRPDVLFLPGFYPEVAKIIRQARALGYNGPIVGGDGWEENILTTLLPPELLNNTYYCNHYSPQDQTPTVLAFNARYKAFSGAEEPTQTAVLAYDATMLLADAIRRANSCDREKIRSALEQTRHFPAISGAITLDEHHNALKDAVIIEIKNGKGQFLQRVSAQ